MYTENVVVNRSGTVAQGRIQMEPLQTYTRLRARKQHRNFFGPDGALSLKEKSTRPSNAEPPLAYEGRQAGLFRTIDILSACEYPDTALGQRARPKARSSRWKSASRQRTVPAGKRTLAPGMTHIHFTANLSSGQETSRPPRQIRARTK